MGPSPWAAPEKETGDIQHEQIPGNSSGGRQLLNLPFCRKAMRRHEMELPETQQINRLWQQKALNCAEFFNAPEDKKYVQSVEETLKTLVGINS